MRNRAITMAAVAVAMVVGTAPAQAKMRPARTRRIDVCMPGNPTDEITSPAKMIASEIYDRIGVDLRWHATRCPADGIRVTLQYSTPKTERPGALAYAVVSDGTHIVVFYDRVIAERHGDRAVAIVFGHVLAHEVGHILQGVSRHSETGLMKAHWMPGDYELMQAYSLRFTDEDVNLIYSGIERRTATLTASRH